MTKDRSFPLRTSGAGLLIAVGGWQGMDLPLDHAALVGGSATGAGVLMTAGAVAWWAQGRGSTGATISRWSRRRQRTDGTATFLDHYRRTSAVAMHRRVTHLRPSLADVSLVGRLRLPMTAVAVPLGKAGHRRLYASMEDNVLRVAGPRSGKTTAMAARIVDAPGGCVVTSTRVDLLRTLPIRAGLGPCHVYDPAGISGHGSTIKWSPLAGCRRPNIAQQRGYDMIPESGSAEGERWDSQARRVLGVLMHAAALADRPMRTVMRWMSADGAALQQVASEVDQALTRSPMADMMRLTARQYFATVDRTRSSIVTTAMPALSWLNDPRASTVGDCDVAESMDLGDLIDRSGTLYILGRNDGTTGPLTGALVAELIRLAEVTAEQRGGRLDPPMTLVLDEAPKVAPGPLHQWSADCGGRGILLDVAAQSLAALEATWGPAPARMIQSNANVILVGAGCKDPGDLAHWEKLSGTRNETVETHDPDGKLMSRTTRPVPVISAEQIANLEKGQAIVYGAGPVTIVRTPNTWARRDVRRALRRAVDLPKQTNYEDTMTDEERETEGAKS
jgi:type IV secretion system protein VirD4